MKSSTNLELDPYFSQCVSNPAIAAFLAGRLVARLRFHLQQAWLLGSSYHAKKPRSLAWKEHARQWKLVEQTFGALSLRCTDLAAADPKRLSERVLAFQDELDCRAFPDGRLDSVDDLTDELIRAPRERSREVYCIDLISQHVTPLISRLHQEIAGTLSIQDHSIFEFGEVLEDGLCRPDVYNFLIPIGGWPVICETDLSHALQELEALDDWEAGHESEDGSHLELEGLASLGREPGDLAPQDTWWTALPLLCSKTGMAIDLPLTFEPLAANSRSRRISTEQLTAAIEELSALVVTAIGASLALSTVNCRWRVDTSTHYLYFNGEKEKVEPDVACYLHELSDRAWHTFSEIRRNHPDHFSKHDKFERFWKKVPKHIQSLIQIDKESKKGSRIRPSHVATDRANLPP